VTKGPRLLGLKRPLLYIVLILILGLAVTLLGSDLRGDVGKEQLTGEELLIDAAGGPVILFVEVVDTNKTRASGLMFREELAPNAGMLFDFKREQPVSFWMKNTFIPLDVFFIKADGRIVNIAKRAVPHSERSIASDEPVLGVLETNAGVADRLGIKLGDIVRHPVFGNAP
jgi:uncharacterized membrane protein (UPF0127 family)